MSKICSAEASMGPWGSLQEVLSHRAQLLQELPLGLGIPSIRFLGLPQPGSVSTRFPGSKLTLACMVMLSRRWKSGLEGCGAPWGSSEPLWQPQNIPQNCKE